MKQTFSATVILKNELNVYMTGELLPNSLDLISDYIDMDVKSSMSNYKSQSFQSTIPIPSYLIAIVAGNVIQQQIGARTYVITEPTQM